MTVEKHGGRGEPVHVLMSRVMQDIRAIEKDQTNPHFNYAFRGIDQVYNALWGPLTEHGVFYVPKIISKELTPGNKGWHCAVTIRYRFYGPKGDYVEAEGMGEAIDNQDKASTKAQQMALKYALLSTFCIPTEEQRRDDPDGHAPIEVAGEPHQQTARRESGSSPSSGSRRNTSGSSPSAGPATPSAATGGEKSKPATSSPAPSQAPLDGGTLLAAHPWAEIRKVARDIAMAHPGQPVPLKPEQLADVSDEVLAEITKRLEGAKA